MTSSLQRTLAAFASLGLILGAATACTGDTAPAASTNVAGAPTSTTGTPTQAVEGSTTSGTPSPSGGGSSAPVSAPTAPQPAVTTEDPQYIGTPAPGSTWTPPTLTAEQVESNKKFRHDGFGLEYVDPTIAMAVKKREVPRPYIADEFQAQDDLGAIKMVAFFYQSIDYLFATGDPEPLKFSSTTNLEYSASIQVQMSDWIKDGAYVTSDPIYVENLVITDRQPGKYTLEGDVTYDGASAYYKESSALVTEINQSGKWRFTVTWLDDGLWAVSGLQKIEK
ncbi:hypothetical protein JT358_17100 [Micrococcales bacterium 31B]|nr:hypothetical protein [Micrococcales bacterium 31B]